MSAASFGHLRAVAVGGNLMYAEANGHLVYCAQTTCLPCGPQAAAMLVHVDSISHGTFEYWVVNDTLDIPSHPDRYIDTCIYNGRAIGGDPLEDIIDGNGDHLIGSARGSLNINSMPDQPNFIFDTDYNYVADIGVIGNYTGENSLTHDPDGTAIVTCVDNPFP